MIDQALSELVSSRKRLMINENHCPETLPADSCVVYTASASIKDITCDV